MQESRTIADRHCALGCITQLNSELLKLSIDFRCVFDVIQESDIVTRLNRRQMCAHDFLRRFRFQLLFSVNRDQLIRRELRAFFKTAAPFKRAQYLLCRILSFLNVGLIERIDPETPSRNGCSKLPLKKLSAQIVNVSRVTINNRMSGGCERVA